jgi:hypothetical protein
VSFTDTLGKAANAVGLGPTYDATKSLIFDISSIGSNDKPWTTDALNIGIDLFKAGASVVPGPIKKAVGTVLTDVALPIAIKSYELGGEYVREPIAAGLLAARTGDLNKSWEQRDEISPGQAMVYLQSAFDPLKNELRGDFDIFNENDRKIFSDQWEYRTVTGAYDTFFTTVTDPLGKLGKGIALARKAMVTQGLGAVDATGKTLARDFLIPRTTRKVTILSPQTLASRLEEGAVEGGQLYPTLKWFAESDSTKIRFHPMVDQSSDANTLSFLLGEAKTPAQVADTLLATALKDEEAMARLVMGRKDLMFVFDKLKTVSSSEKAALDNIPTNGITDDLNKLDAADSYLQTLANDPYFATLAAVSDRGLDLTKRTFGTEFFANRALGTAERRANKALSNDLSSYPTTQYFQSTKYHPTVAVINWASERPSNWINGNDADSFNELVAYGGMLRRLVGEEAANPLIQGQLKQYISAGDMVEARLKSAEDFEIMAARLIHAKLGVSDEVGQKIWSAFSSRRSSAMAMMRDRKFLMTDDDMILKIPYLERQGGNAMPLLDLERYYEVLDKNKGLMQALEGSKNIVNPSTDKYIMGILNDTWKASVLLRLGYTVRNLTEASLSILGKGYGLVWAGQFNEQAVGNWFENRVQGIDRWTDRKLVAKGVRTDSVKTRRELARRDSLLYASDRVLQQSLQYVKAAELAFKQGKLTEEQLLEYLKLSDAATGEMLYHGSPVGFGDDLDLSRPIAMVDTENAATRYAEASMPTISVSEMYARQGGRRVRLPDAAEGEVIRGTSRNASARMKQVTDQLRQGLINSMDNGNVVEYISEGAMSWRLANPRTMTDDYMMKAKFRIRKPGTTSTTMGGTVYGKALDIRTWGGTAGGPAVSDFPELMTILGGTDGRAWRRGDAWKGKEKQILAWMRENGYGKVKLPDPKNPGKHTIIVDPAMVETATQKPTLVMAEKKLREAYEARIAAGADPSAYVAGEKEAGTELARIAEVIAAKNYPSEGILGTIREIADAHVALKSEQSQILETLGARMVEEARIAAPRKMQGQGFTTIRLYDGSTIEIPEAFQGELGTILASRLDNAETYRMLVDHPSQLFTARHGYMTEAHLKPTMPEYYSGYANHLNTFFKSPDGQIDPIIEQFLNGATPQDIVKWLRSEKSGDYRTRFNIDGKGYMVQSEKLNVGTDAEDFAANLYSAYQRYLPDEMIQETFRAGQVDELWLRTHFADAKSMPDLIGRIVPTSPEAVNAMEKLSAFQNQAFYFLGSLPETTLARHPLARAIYAAEMEQRANIALAIKRRNFGQDAELTPDDINTIRKGAVEGTRREVNKTLFTIIRKSYAGETLRFIMPFFNAWENTIRRWSGLSVANPAVVARAGQITQMLANSKMMVDSDGNPTDQFSYENSIILPMPQTFADVVGAVPFVGKDLKQALKASGMSVGIPIKSMDVIFQGEVTAGFGPIAALPASELVKMRPDLEDLFEPVLPFGPNQSWGSLKMLVPPAAQKFLSKASQDEAWARTFNTVYSYELIRYNLGERKEEPTLDEIKKLTDNMFTIKMWSNLTLPFAAQYDSPLSFYGKQFRKLQEAHGFEAEAMFLEMYPEAASAIISASYNPTGAQASQEAYQKTKRYSKLIGQIAPDTPELVGFLVNDPDNKYTFSTAVYQWQYKSSTAPGSDENFRQRRNPAELKKEADKRMGWYKYNKIMNTLDPQLAERGLTSYTSSGAEDLKEEKDRVVGELKKSNIHWYADFMDTTQSRWLYRMANIDTFLNDAQWLKDNRNNPVLNPLVTYMSERKKIAKQLAERRAMGMATTLAAQDNFDLQEQWDEVVFTLKQESTEFTQFYNRFLQNDPVTLG